MSKEIGSDSIRLPGPSDSISVKMSAMSVTATRELHDPLTITSKWNEETLSGDFVVDGKVLPAWRISQKVLGDYFFSA